MPASSLMSAAQSSVVKQGRKKKNKKKPRPYSPPPSILPSPPMIPTDFDDSDTLATIRDNLLRSKGKNHLASIDKIVQHPSLSLE